MKFNPITTATFMLTASAGLIHASPTENDQSTAVVSQTKDIVTITGAAEDFSIFVAAIKAAGLDETLRGQGPFTVFAPNNAAFEALPEGSVVKLLEPENKELLAGILRYHVIPRKFLSVDAAPMALKTLEGSDSTVTLEGKTMMINGARIIQADIVASNGIIHAIDKVISPPAKDDASTD